MKDKIHPNYKESTIVCACGETIHTRSTKQNIRVEICSKCHPFYTGQLKYIDSLGRVEKFQAKQKKAETQRSFLDAKKIKKQGQRVTEQQTPKTLREMLLGK